MRTCLDLVPSPCICPCGTSLAGPPLHRMQRLPGVQSRLHLNYLDTYTSLDEIRWSYNCPLGSGHLCMRDTLCGELLTLIGGPAPELSSAEYLLWSLLT